MKAAHTAIAPVTATRAANARRSALNQQRCECGLQSAAEQCPRCGAHLLQRRAVGIGGSDDPLEREADRAADTVLAGGRVGRTLSTADASHVQRSAVYAREPIGTSGRFKTGPLKDWDFVVYQDHVKVGNRVLDKNTGQVIGSWPWLTNNPGDITVDPKEADKPRSALNRAFEWKAVKGKAASTGHILLAIFPDMSAGGEALKKLFAEPDYRDKTLAGAIEQHLGRKESRVPGVDDPKKYLERVKKRANELGVKDELLGKTLSELAVAGVLDQLVSGFGVAEGVENVGATYRCNGRDKADDPKIPKTVRDLRLFKSLPDDAPDEVLRLLGCQVRTSVQKKAAAPSGESVAPRVVDDVLSSNGETLDALTRQTMEERFGHDFERVRVHADAQADRSARAMNALAYTVGRHVVFAVGRFAPRSREGQRLLAHELAHVVQQSGQSAPALRRKPGPDRIQDLQRQLQDKQAERARLQKELDASQDRAVDDIYNRRIAGGGDKEAARLKAAAQGDLQTTIAAHAMRVLKRAVKVVRSGNQVTLNTRFELSYLALSETDAKRRAATDIPRLEKTIRDAWQVQITKGRYPGIKFQLEPKIVLRSKSQKAGDDALQIIVRGADKQPSTGTFWTGEISLAAGHLEGDRIIVVAHELYHLFSYFDAYMTAWMPSKKVKGQKEKSLVVGRPDPAGRGDLLGMPDPKHLREALKRGEITQADFDRQTKQQLHVWEEDADAILFALGVPPTTQTPTQTPAATKPGNQDFDPDQAASELEAIKRRGEQRLEQLRRETRRYEEASDWVTKAERAMQLDTEIAELQKKVAQLKATAQPPARP